MGRYKRSIRPRTIDVVREVERTEIFDIVTFNPNHGQPGAFVDIKRGLLKALLRRESKPTEIGYNATRKRPTRITYLSISRERIDRERRPYEYYGTFDPTCIPRQKHSFERQAEENPELKQFLEYILKYFNP